MDVAASQTGHERVKDAIGERCQKLFHDMLEDFRDEDGNVKYRSEAEALSKPERNTIFVVYADIVNFNSNLGALVAEEYFRVYPYLCRALRNYIKEISECSAEELKNKYVAVRGFDVRTKIRELDTKRIGSLLRISGQVVRTHPVHPELVLGTFKCLDCQTIVKDVEQQFKYTQPAICTNPICANRTKFALEVGMSKFVDFQKVRIQEVQAELPRGCIPRSVEVILRGEAVETAQAGDRCDFTGTMIVVPDVGALAVPGTRTVSATRTGEGASEEGLKGLKALGVRELHYRCAFLANYVEPTSPKFGGLRLDAENVTPELLQNHLTQEDWAKIHKMSTDKNLYQNLIKSLFPTIHGNDEIKRGVLLMLFGGLGKNTIEGTKLRGDINVLIVGDPSTAKSQMLKQVAEFSPRAIYTSGKASSAAGLTAAVVKDEESFESVIEAGALMLADNGVCCIDEFDKMDLKDQVAIHEAMEQQTISIAKAGVRATLNARTSILAAANPIGGKYDRSKSLKLNVNLSPPILSRFDLFFVIIDECNEVTDYAIARSIVNLHSYTGRDNTGKIYSAEEIRQYIMFARLFKPKMTRDAAQFLVEQYKNLRQRDSGSNRSAWRITVRQLESMVRLSEAMARMYCCTSIEVKHVKEAYRLLNKSIIRVEQPDVDFDELEDNDLDGMEEDVENVEPNGQATDAMELDAHDKIAEGRLKLKIPFSEYQQISNLLVLHMRQVEEQAEEATGTSDDTTTGLEGAVRRSALIKWYIEDVIGDEIESEEELRQKQTLLGKIVDRLTYRDHILIPLTRTRMDGEDMDDEGDDCLLVVHPNYVLS